MTIGERIREARKHKRMTTTQLARMVDLTPGAINQIENGKTKMPGFDTGLLIARALGVDEWYLAFGEGPDAQRDYGAEIDELRQRIDAIASRQGP